MTDFSHVPTRQDAIHLRLEQWGHWCTAHPTGGNVAPMFRLYRSKARQWEMPVIHVQALPKDNLEIERAVRIVPEPHRTILRWAYCFPWVPPSKVRQETHCTRQELADKLIHRRGTWWLFGCCARLVRSCRPWKAAQEAMFAVIARQPGRPTKDAVIAQIRAMDAEAKC